MPDAPKPHLTPQLQFLQDSCRDGLWSYLHEGSADTALEPSVWCAVACRKLPVAAQFVQKLVSMQNRDGGWSSYGAPVSDWTTSVALLGIRLLATTAEHRRAFNRGIEFLMDTRTDNFSGVVKAAYLLWRGPEYRYARGWPWTPNTYDWVEPTAYVLLALKGTSFEKSQSALSQALEDAEEFLMRSYCYTGGWDHADRTELELKKFEAEHGAHHPYAYPTFTSLALLALQSRGKGPPMAGGLKYLATAALESESSLGLAWSALALNAFGENIEKQQELLKSHLRKDGSVSNQMITNALATIVLSMENDGNPLKTPLPA